MAKGYKSRLALFTDTERKYIDAYAGEPRQRYASPISESDREGSLSGISTKDVESRLRKKTDPREIADFIRGFIDDLQRLENYYRYVEGGQVDLYMLRRELKDTGELENLRLLIDPWDDLAEEPHPLSPERRPGEISEALEPLRDGLMDMKTSERIPEASARSESMLWILRHDEPDSLLECLRFFAKTEPRIQQGTERSTLQENTIGKSEWLKYAPRWLGSKHGLIEEHQRSGRRKAYQLTERGKAVLETIENLIEAKLVTDRAEEHGETVFESAAILVGKKETDA